MLHLPAFLKMIALKPEKFQKSWIVSHSHSIKPELTLRKLDAACLAILTFVRYNALNFCNDVVIFSLITLSLSPLHSHSPLRRFNRLILQPSNYCGFAPS